MGFNRKKRTTMTFEPWGSLSFVVGLMGFVTLLDLENYS
jgi:hypothetical protein